MPIKVVVEFQAKPGVRADSKLLADISATHGPQAPGFLGSTVYEVLDSPDRLVEIAGGSPQRSKRQPLSRPSPQVSTHPSSNSWRLRSRPPESANCRRATARSGLSAPPYNPAARLSA